jgi:hypothetical protein
MKVTGGYAPEDYEQAEYWSWLPQGGDFPFLLRFIKWPFFQRFNRQKSTRPSRSSSSRDAESWTGGFNNSSGSAFIPMQTAYGAGSGNANRSGSVSKKSGRGQHKTSDGSDSVPVQRTYGPKTTGLKDERGLIVM